MGVAGKVEVIDVRSLQNGRLLWTDVRRKKEDPVTLEIRVEDCAPAVQLRGYDPGILVPEMPLLLNKETDRTLGRLPHDNTVELSHGFAGWADLRLRHPFLERGPVGLEIGVLHLAGHVHYYSMFINNEQRYLSNITQRGLRRAPGRIQPRWKSLPESCYRALSHNTEDR